jgi:hypothetical protein
MTFLQQMFPLFDRKILQIVDHHMSTFTYVIRTLLNWVMLALDGSGQARPLLSKKSHLSG